MNLVKVYSDFIMIKTRIILIIVRMKMTTSIVKTHIGILSPKKSVNICTAVLTTLGYLMVED